MTTATGRREERRATAPMTRSAFSRALLVVIDWYQAARAGRPSPCRYWPSCSQYAREAVEGHGGVRGSWLAARRLARCHPWGGSGVDPVPVGEPGKPAGTGRAG